MQDFSESNWILRQLSRNTAAAAILREAARISERDGEKLITPDAIQTAAENYKRVLDEMVNKEI